MAKIAVIGAGVIGLATAINIQKLIPSCTVTIIADQFEKETTSYGAGGIIRPTFEHIKGERVVVRRWCETSWNYFKSLCLSGKSSATGIYLMDGYLLSSKAEIDELLQSIVFNIRLLSDEEKKKKGFSMPYVYSISNMGVSPPEFLPFLMKTFRQQGGNVYFKTVASLKEFVGKFDIVVNCCGLRSQQLVNDNTIFPVRGQLRRVRAPWIKHWYMNIDDDTYLIPQFNGDVVLGGCRQKGNYSLEISKTLQDDITKRCEDLVPEIKGAQIVSDWVGLRPTRVPVRLEKEYMEFDGQKLMVVHNYGHGANGISLSWGTAVDAAQLVGDWAQQISKSSKL